MKAQRKKRRWLRFSLRTVFVLITVLGVCLGIVINQARNRKKAIVAIDELGGTYGVYSVGPKWLRDLVKDERYFYDAGRVSFGPSNPAYTHEFRNEDLERMVDLLNVFSHFRMLDIAGTHISDDGLRHLKRLRNLEHLRLSSTVVSDRGLEHLKGIKTLREIELTDTDVTDQGVAELRRALPMCKITH